MLSLLLFFAAVGTAFSAPPPVIFDTDMGNDVDDALALAMLHALDARGECKLIGVTLTNPAASAAPFTSLMNRFYGRADIPVGASGARRKDGASSKYLDATLESAPSSWKAPALEKFEDAVRLLRRLLARSAEKVVIVQVGFSETLAGLLDSRPDDLSPLDGAALAREKVELVSAMAGDFSSERPEFNIKINIPAAQKVFRSWPGKIVISGYEIGKELLFPAASIERDFGYVPWHPVAVAYRAYLKMPYDRPTWDLTAVLAAVRPGAGYFDLSPTGMVEVDDKGSTRFHAAADGRDRYLVLPADRRPRVLEALTLLSSEPPHK